MIDEKTTFEEGIKNIPIINRNPSPEELEEKRKWFATRHLTSKQSSALAKEDCKAIKEGRLPGYIDENGKPHLFR